MPQFPLQDNEAHSSLKSTLRCMDKKCDGRATTQDQSAWFVILMHYCTMGRGGEISSSISPSGKQQALHLAPITTFTRLEQSMPDPGFLYDLSEKGGRDHYTRRKQDHIYSQPNTVHPLWQWTLFYPGGVLISPSSL